jgi:hypothetical protein
MLKHEPTFLFLGLDLLFLDLPVAFDGKVEVSADFISSALEPDHNVEVAGKIEALIALAVDSQKVQEHPLQVLAAHLFLLS